MWAIYVLAIGGLFFAPRAFVALALLLLAYQSLCAAVFVGATRYRVAWDFLVVLLATATLKRGAEWLRERRAREGRARPSDPRDRRLGAASADAAAGARGARDRAGARRARRPGVGSGRLLRRAARAVDPHSVAARRRPAAARAARPLAPRRRRAHASRARRRLRRSRGEAARRAARLDEAQRRSVPARSVPPRRARDHAPHRSRGDDHRRAAPVHGRGGRDPGGEGRDDPLRARRPAGGRGARTRRTRCPTARACCSRCRG